MFTYLFFALWIRSVQIDSLSVRFAHASFAIPQRDALSRVSDSTSIRPKMASEASHLHTYIANLPIQFQAQV